jgi:predicted nucleic acid binding AN1-type Zn finger protein
LSDIPFSFAALLKFINQELKSSFAKQISKFTVKKIKVKKVKTAMNCLILYIFDYEKNNILTYNDFN